MRRGLTLDKVMPLLEAGYSDSAIARHFGVDHTSIRYWRERAGVKNPYSLPKLPPLGKSSDFDEWGRAR